MWPVLVCFVDTFWEDAHLRDLNDFLVVIFIDGQLNILEGSILLVLWFKDFYVIISIFICFWSQIIRICCLYTSFA